MIIAAVILGLAVLVLVHELGHFAAAKWFGVKVEEFGIGYPPKILWKKIGETVYSLNLLPLGGFVRIHGEDEGEGTGAALEAGRGFIHKAAWKRAVILIAGITMNVFAGWIIFSAVFMIGSPEHLMISGVSEGSPAAAEGLALGDVVTRATFGSVTMDDPIRADAFIAAVKEANGSRIALSLSRNGETKEVTIVPRVNPPEGQGALGVELADAGFPREPFFAAIADGFTTTFSVLWMTVKGFVMLILGVFTEPRTALQGVAGPIGIFTLAAETGKIGFTYLAQLIGFISINLAVLNLIPFPALDGGRVLFLLIEKIKGKPISSRSQRMVNATGFVMLILLMILVTIHDVRKM